MGSEKFNVLPSKLYEGPDFEEYCISEGKYLPASRDRAPCIACPLGNLCQAGFEEQVKRILNGDNPSLTEGCVFDPDALSRPRLLSGLSEEQRQFVVDKIPGLHELEEP